MRLVIQRVSSASVSIDGKVHAAIEKGLMVLVGIADEDAEQDAEWLCGKLVSMRIFADEEGKMNKSVKEINGGVLLISQFTLHASTQKGNRPSFIKAARPEKAIPLYEGLIKLLKAELPDAVRTGVFGADMKVALVNDGPVTIVMDSKGRE